MPPLRVAVQAAPDARLLFLANLVTVVAVVLFAAGVVYVLARRSYQRRVEEQKMAAMGTATARILHQIKNPLQTIILHADLLEEAERSGTPDTRAEICSAMVEESQRLSAMLNELSVYASGARRLLSLEPYPLHELLRQLARNEARDGRVRVDATAVEEVMVRADGYYLRQAVENLIDNARDAMEGQADRRLALRLERAGGQAQLAVVDNGPGIPAERLETIFQPFVSTKSKGMGLGLAICKEIVEGHGGRVEVDSHPGSGTAFRILLPLHAPLEAPAREAAPGGAL